jgi:hypothetical protein
MPYNVIEPGRRRMAPANRQLRPSGNTARAASLIALVILSLTISLGTRVFRISVPHGVSAQSSAPQAMRQHLDRDATRWPVPIFDLTILDAPTFYPRMAPAGLPIPGLLLLDKSLYNRPPPSC